MAHEECPQVDWRAPAREVDEDVVVAGPDDADGQLVGEQPHRLRRAFAKHHVRQLLLFESVLAAPQHDVAPLVGLGAQPQVLAVGQNGVEESFETAGEFEVVGVVRDTKYASVRDPGPPTMYRCVWQTTQRNLHVVLKTAGEPLAMSETVRAVMREIDPTVPIQELTSQSEHISQRLAQERLFARAYAAFGALAVLLACFGLFGLMSYNVARRTSEIGVRMALGAQRRTVVGMVMSESIRLVAIGSVLGLAAVLWAGRFVRTVVYGVSASDPLTIGGAVALIAVVTALAGGVPARRASNVNPIDALRQQ